MDTSNFLYTIQNSLNRAQIGDTSLSNDLAYMTKLQVGSSHSEVVVPFYDIMKLSNIMYLNNDRPTRYREYREMTKDNPLIASAVATYADNATQCNYVDNHVIKVEVDMDDDSMLKKDIETMSFQRINVDDSSWNIVHETCKMGDFYAEVVPQQDMKGVSHLRYINHIDNIYRVETQSGQIICWLVSEISMDSMTLSDKNASQFVDQKLLNSIKSFVQKHTNSFSENVKIMAPWQIIHWRIENNDVDFIPYGYSILENCRKSWKQWRMMENAMLINCINHAPERFVFGIPVGDNIDPDEAIAYVKRISQLHRKRSIVNDRGEVDEQASSLAVDEHIYLPIPSGGVAPTVSKLEGAKNLQGVNDVVAYFKQKVLGALGLPPTFGGAESNVDERKVSLAHLDIQFARRVQRIQRSFCRQYMKVVAIHLFLRGYSKKMIDAVKVSMTPPNALIHAAQLENIKNKYEIAKSVKDLDAVSNFKILVDILGFSAEEADMEVKRRRWEDAQLTSEEGMLQDSLKSESFSNIVDIVKKQIKDAESSEAKPDQSSSGGGGEVTGLGAASPTSTAGAAPEAGTELEGGTESGAGVEGAAGETETGLITASNSKKFVNSLNETLSAILNTRNVSNDRSNIVDVLRNLSGATLSSSLLELFNTNELWGLHHLIKHNHEENIKLNEGKGNENDYALTDCQTELVTLCENVSKNIDDYIKNDKLKIVGMPVVATKS
jgi:hypothetical protein